MHVARKAGATGGTVVKGRLPDVEQFSEFGLNSAANGIIFAVPTEKAYKI